MTKDTDMFPRVWDVNLGLFNGKEQVLGRARWFPPVIPALWEAEMRESLEARSLEPLSATQSDHVSTKYEKLAGLVVHASSPSYWRG